TWAIATIAAVNILWAWSRGRRFERATDPARGVTPAPSPVFVIAIVGLAIGRAMFGLRNPPADIDTLVYHLPMVAFWFQSGSLGAPLTFPPSIGTYFPGNGELLQLWTVFALHRETLMP